MANLLLVEQTITKKDCEGLVMTDISLSNNSLFSLSHKTEVQVMVKSLFQNTDFDYFIYLRGEKDGSLSVISSDEGFFRDWISRGYPAPIRFDAQYKAIHTYSYLWKDKYPPELLSLAEEKHNLYNGISIVKRYKNYFEIFGFASSNPMVAGATSTYLSCLTSLQNFSDYFVKVAKNLIKIAKNCPLIPSSSFTIKRCGEFLLWQKGKQYTLKGLLGDTYLTSQEFISLQIFLKGRSYKDIGRILSISPRTVEKHLKNVKKKIGCPLRHIKFLYEAENKLHIMSAAPAAL